MKKAKQEEKQELKIQKEQQEKELQEIEKDEEKLTETAKSDNTTELAVGLSTLKNNDDVEKLPLPPPPSSTTDNNTVNPPKPPLEDDNIIDLTNETIPNKVKKMNEKELQTMLSIALSADFNERSIS